jgi:uncharacterized membrane protein YidH (DUF202 family)
MRLEAGMRALTGRAGPTPADRLARAVHLSGMEVAVKLIGVLLIVFGVVALAVGGIRYTTREKVLDIGPIEATSEKHHMIPLSPIVGIASVAGGIALVVAGSRRRV